MAEKVALALGMAASTGLLAQLRVPLPFALKPTTGEVFAVLLAGMLLGRWYGGLSLALYAAIGAAGATWFAGWKGGLEVLTGVSGGYIIGFVAAAFAIGWLTERYVSARSFLPLLVLMLVGVGVIYLFVAVWLAIVPEAGFSVAAAAVDLVKAAVVAAIAYVLLPDTAFRSEAGAASAAGRRTLSPGRRGRTARRLAEAAVEEPQAKAGVAVGPVADAVVEEPEAEAGMAGDAPTEMAPVEELTVERLADGGEVVEAVVEEPGAEAAIGAAPEEQVVLGELEAIAAPQAAPAAKAAAEEEDPGREPTDEERNALYSGEVELALVPPLNAAVVSQLHSMLLSNPELKILRTVGSWERGTTITVFLDRALPLVGVLTEIPEVRLSSQAKAEGRGGVFAGRISITMKRGLADNGAAGGK